LASLPAPSQTLLDWILGLGLTGLAELQLALLSNCCQGGTLRISATFLLTAVQTLPIIVRRRAPFPILLLTGLAALAQFLLREPTTDFGTFGVLVAFYTVSAQGERRLAVWVAVLVAIGIVVAKLLDVRMQIHVDDLIVLYAQFVAAWVLADNSRYRRRHIEDLEDRAARIERENEYRARVAVADERARIARELHDVIAHSLSVITLQAGAARTVIDTKPDSARACLRSIEAVGKEAWTEMRRLLDLVREDDETGAQSPQPSLELLPGLIRRFGEAGLSVELVVSGRRRALPAAVDLSLYRIVQEALTNTLKHAGPVRARVAIAFEPSAVEVDVADAGGGAVNGQGFTAGHGLLGMHERVRLFGGELRTGFRDGGFAVTARLPVEAVEAVEAIGA
jgi:signal transduction histidine kinase